MFNLLRYELISRWPALLGWGVGLALFGALYIGIYPQFGEQMQALMDILDIPIYRAMGIDMGSFEGFMASSVIQFIPLTLAIYVVISSTDTLAGEEERGTLELVVAMPLKRWEIVSMKAIALIVISFFILIITAVGDIVVFQWMQAQIEVDVTSTQLFVAILDVWPITVAFLMIGMFLSTFMPTRRIASMTLTTIIIVSYFAEILAGIVNSLDFLKPWSLFSYFDSTANLFLVGVKTSDVMVLLGVSVVFFGLTLVTFEKRDITVGLWPWQRAKMH